jgi:hypothetical protein
MVSLSPIGQTTVVQVHDHLVQDATGYFELPYVLPGTYALTAAAPPIDQRMTAHRVIDVGNSDVSGIQLTLATPQTLRGTLVPPDGRKMPAGLIVALLSRETRLNAGGGIGQPAAGDALATGLHLGAQPLGTLKIVLKANGATLQASAKTSEGKPLPDATIKLVPEPPRRTQMALYKDCKTNASVGVMVPHSPRRQRGESIWWSAQW